VTPDIGLSFSTVRIIPVIDLKDGLVVRGVAGQRDHYQPIESQLVEGAEPGDVARALVDRFSAEEIYVADLDAIGGRDPDRESLQRIAGAGIPAWIDAGTGTPESCQRLLDLLGEIPLDAQLIVGLESVGSPRQLAACLDVIDPSKAIFSLDLQQGIPLDGSGHWPRAAREIAELAIAAGFPRLIVLDLAGVGMGAGIPTLQLCRQLSDDYPDVEWISGGGVRGSEDLEAMGQHGVSAALVASALHDGRIRG
jgi:phosphoribosylformimino-5-aminoimidazole carboxamide ribotide isomerase